MPEETNEKSKVVPPIEDQIIAFLESRGVYDWAFVLVDKAGGVRSRWGAGDGQDPVADRKRMGDVHFELEILQAQIVNYQVRPPVLGNAPAPINKVKKERKRGKR